MHSRVSGTQLLNYMLIICGMNQWTNVNVLSKNLQGLPCQTWVHFHSSTWRSSASTATTFFSFSLLLLHGLSDEVPFLSPPFIKSSLPGLGPLSSSKLSWAYYLGLFGTLPSILILFSTIPQLLSGLTSPPVKSPWPWWPALLSLLLLLLPPHPSPWSWALRLLFLPKSHSFW